MTNSSISVVFHTDTGLIELVSPGGSMMLTELEAALLYTVLCKSLGIRGRFRLWRIKNK